MIVDDEEAITQLTALMLKHRGFTVEEFNDVHSALEAVQAKPKEYNFAVVDYMMPGMTGLELAHELYTLNSKMPVVIVTGLIEKSTFDISNYPNVVEILKKPFDIDDLVAIIDRSR